MLMLSGGSKTITGKIDPWPVCWTGRSRRRKSISDGGFHAPGYQNAMKIENGLMGSRLAPSLFSRRLHQPNQRRGQEQKI